MIRSKAEFYNKAIKILVIQVFNEKSCVALLRFPPQVKSKSSEVLVIVHRKRKDELRGISTGKNKQVKSQAAPVKK